MSHAPLSFSRAEPSLMGMPHAAEKWTAARVRALPDDGRRYELVSGELLVTPAPRPRHQLALAALYDRLAPYLAETGLGRLLWSPADLALGEDEVLQPDLFVVPGRETQSLRAWTDVTALLLVIEVVSPSTAHYDRQLKRLRYQRAGVPEYWIVDPDARIIERWRPADTRPEVLSEVMEWIPKSGVAPLQLDLKVFFAAICE